VPSKSPLCEWGFYTWYNIYMGLFEDVVGGVVDGVGDVVDGVVDAVDDLFD
jgi:hypothetical protein